MVVTAHQQVRQASPAMPKVNSNNLRLQNAHIRNSSNSARNSKENFHDSSTRGTPVKPGKRRHHAICSPVTTRVESLSPTAKQQTVERKVTRINLENDKASEEKPISKQCPPEGNACLAVPKVYAEPPSPSQLPSPPTHWVAGKGMQCHAKKQQCRAATKSLVSHLSTSGIYVAAQ